jgi:hypothetical protein
MALAQGTVLPAWVALGMTGIGMVLVASYVLAVQRDSVPISRRRLRTANGVVQMFLLGTIGFASGVVLEQDKSLFLTSWLLVMVLVTVVILLAVIDIANNIRLAGRERQTQRRESAARLAADLRELRARASGNTAIDQNSSQVNRGTSDAQPGPRKGGL